MKSHKSYPKGGFSIDQNDKNMYQEAITGCTVHQLGIFVMNEFMLLFHSDKFHQAVILGNHFTKTYIPNKFKRGNQDTDARPTTQILNTIEVYMLHMSSNLNEALIKLAQNLEQPELKQKVLELLFSIVVAFKSTMKSRNERIENTVRHNLKYTSEQFADIIEALGLTAEFQKWMAFMDKLLTDNAKGDLPQQMTVGGVSFTLNITEAQQKGMEEIEERKEWNKWITKETSQYQNLVTTMVQTNEKCRERLDTWINWFEELDGLSEDYLHLNEKYDLSVGIDVKNRTISASIKLPELSDQEDKQQEEAKKGD